MNTIGKPFDLAFYLSPDAGNLDAELGLFRELGISSVGTNGWMAWRDPREIRRVGERFRAHGMKVASCHSSIGIGWLDDIEKSVEDNRRIVDCAAEWGSPSTVWHHRWPRSRKGDTHFLSWEEVDALDPAETDRVFEQILLPACEYAVSCGVSINLENLPLLSWGDNPGEILEFIRKFNHPGLGFILDSEHAWVSGYDPAEVIRAAGPLLRDTHFHDSVGLRNFPKGKVISYKDVGRYDPDLVPGLGTICWMEVVRALRETEFPGPVVFEGPHIPGDSSGNPRRRSIGLSIRMWRAFEDMATGCSNPVSIPV